MSYTPPLEAEVTAFKTTALLANGATYTSSDVDWDGNVNGYSQVQTEILASHDGQIDISFCEDSAFTDVVRTISIPYTASGGYQFFAAPAFANFIKYEFTNDGGVTQTDFYYTTKLLTVPISPQLLTTGAFIAPSMVTTLGRNITVGKDPNDVFTNSPQGGVSNSNSSVAALGAGATFSGIFVDTSGYSATSIFVKSDQDSAVGGLKIIHSSDGITDERVISFTYLTADNPQGLIYMIPASTKYFRIEYINGSTIQGSFVLSIKNEITPLQTIALPINLPIKNGTLANVTKSVIVGQNDAGTFNNVSTDNQNHLKVDASNNRFTYDEFPISELTAISQLTFPYNINPDLTNTILGGSGTVTQADNMAYISTGGAGSNTATESAALESIKTITYRAGEGALCRISALFTDFAPNGVTSIQGIGLGDANDGYGFTLEGTSSELNVTYRTNGTQSTITQTLWNEDTMDGSGNVNNPSGMLLDPTKGNVYQVSYGSGFGCVYYSIESQATGQMVLVHTLHIANLRTTPSSYNPTFALRSEVFKDGTSDTNDYQLRVSDMASFTQGKDKATGTLNSRENSKSVAGENTVLTLQNKATFQGKTNKVSCIIKLISFFNDNNAPGSFRLYEDATPAVAFTYTDINVNSSVIEYSNDNTTLTGGKLLWASGVGKDSGGQIDLSELAINLRPGSSYSFTGDGGGANEMSIAVVWVEDF